MRYCMLLLITLSTLCGCQQSSEEQKQIESYKGTIGEGEHTIRMGFDSGFSHTIISYVRLDSTFTTFSNRVLNTDELIGLAGAFDYKTNLDTVVFECEIIDEGLKNGQKYHFKIPVKDMVAISFNYLPVEGEQKKMFNYKAFDYEYLYE